MEITMYVNKYKHARYNFFKWRYQLEFYHKVILAISFACITGILSTGAILSPWISGSSDRADLCGAVKCSSAREMVGWH